MHHLLLSVLSTLVTTPIHCLAPPLVLPCWDDVAVKHRWNTVPSNWERLSQPPADTTIDLYVALKPHNENALIDALYEVSDPKHLRYGAHLSKEQVTKLVAPHGDTLGLVHSWLRHHGVPISSISTSHGGNWLTLAGVPVSQANKLLGASYQLYWHSETNDTVVRTLNYSLPAALHEHVETVAPTTLFGSPRTLWKTPRMHPGVATAAQAASGEPVKLLSRGRDPHITPQLLRWLYRTAEYVPTATDHNILGVTGYDGQHPAPLDLTEFMKEYRTDGVDATFTVVQINGGGNDPSNPGMEANFDIQYAQGIAYPTPHVFYSTGGNSDGKLTNTDDPLLHWLKYVLAQPIIPQTIATSYSGEERLFSVDYTTSVCNLFAQLGARGVSVLFSTGDFGVGRGDCKTDGSVRFIPSFPPSCPWLTTVGGTTSYSPEVAASLSGGGFSDYFPRPRYQDRAVYTFFQHPDSGYRDYEGLYNPGGRGIPDISAQALDFLFIFKGKIGVFSGTSCSAPTMAGVVALLNYFLLAQGRPPLGFLNPWLYGSGLAGFNDIMYGSNPGCNTNGFFATPGWDPVTGLGTPDFLKLKELLND